MNPGKSPIFLDPQNVQTNVPPAGGGRYWSLFWHVDENPVPINLRSI